MPASPAQQRATRKYMAKTYDRIEFIVHKGKKETIKSHADSMGESISAFINRAIEEAIERDTADKL